MAVTPKPTSLPSLPAKTTMQYNLGSIVSQTTDLYVDKLKTMPKMPTPAEAQLEFLQYVQQFIITENGYRPKRDQIKTPEAIPAMACAKLAVTMFNIRRIPGAGVNADQEYDILGIYQTSGLDAGTYAVSDYYFKKLFSAFNPLHSAADFKQFKEGLKLYAKRQEPCRDRDLVAVNNGIFNFATKKLQPFTPDLVFLSKCRVDYVDNPANPVIHNPDDNTYWDVESWMADLSDDQEITQLLWEVLGAIIRPNVAWNKAVFFYSETGNNGKGTLCALMRNLAGEHTCASISLADFSKEFTVEPLLRASCVVVDENNVGIYINQGANLKAVITGDVILVNRKYEKPIMFRFRGLMVQCLNEFPRVKDKSESLYRRFLIIPFEKTFTDRERKYIKEDYLARPEVLQYVLWRVLNMNYYELSNPKVCQNALKSYKSYNDPLRQFVDDIFDELQWDYVPFPFLFSLYLAWYKINVSSKGTNIGRTTFNKSIAQLESEIPGWRAETGDVHPPKGTMCKPEKLIMQYNLTEWLDLSYAGGNPYGKCIPVPKKSYRGAFIRVAAKNNVIPLNTSTAADIEPA